jgi:hypothetical protein
MADDLLRQAAHWTAAATTFRDAEEFASADAWRSVEAAVGLPLRKVLGATVEALIAMGREATALARRAASDPSVIPTAHAAVQRFRRRYVQVETTLDFFGDAVNSRTSGPLRTALGVLDRLAVASMEPVLVVARKPVPPVLTYIDKGLGASILRAGIRLWVPGSVNPVCAVKIVRHNLYRPTSAFHETGHAVAHLTSWTGSVRATLARTLADDPQLASMWTPWASEIAADVYAFLHTGYASVAALYDVVGDARTIFRWPVGDPHPIGWLRTLLGCAMADVAFTGPGPRRWRALEAAMVASHPMTGVDPAVRALLLRSRARIRELASACLSAPVPALGGRPMTSVLDPSRVSPAALAELERSVGPALWTSAHWRRTEGIRIVGLAGLREAQDPSSAATWIERARTWMTREAKAA